MRRHIKALAGIAAVVGLATSIQAGVTATDGFTTNTWQGSPTYFNYGASGAINKNPGGAFVAEGSFAVGTGGGSGNLGGLAQSFPITVSGLLSSIQIVLSGGVTTYNVAIYDLGLTSSYVPASGSSFTTNSRIKLATGLNYTAANSGFQSVTKIDFTGADQIFLSAGEEYAFGIEPTSGPSFQVARGGADAFASEQMYKMNQFAAGQYGAINGSGTPFRHMAIAITTVAVPEPSSMALLGLGALVGTFIMRRRVS